MNSPAMKSFADARLADGESRLVVDLSDCTGMDSTFMGTLAGIASRLAERSGALQIAEPGERNRRSLEDLGLDFLMEIDPADASWKPHLTQIRSLVMPTSANTPFSQLQRTRHVLEAHQQLADLSPQNAEAFSHVVDLLQNELTNHKGSEQPPPGS